MCPSKGFQRSEAVGTKLRPQNKEHSENIPKHNVIYSRFKLIFKEGVDDQLEAGV